MASKNVSVEGGWFETLKEKLTIDALLQKFKLSKNKIIEIGLYLGVGFLAGFLLRRYFKYIVVIIAIIVGFVFLEKSGVIHITVDWTRFQEVFGIQISQKIDGGLLSKYWVWIKDNVVVAVSFSVGFFIGLKVG